MPWIGLLLGALIGAYLHGFRGFMAGAAVGLVIGLVLRNTPLAATLKRAALPTAPGAGTSGFAESALAREQANSRHIAILEQRVAALEAALVRSGIPLPLAPAVGSGAPAAGVAQAEETVAKVATAPIADTPPYVMPAPRSPVRKGGAGEPGAVGVTRAASSVSRPASAATPLWSWFTDGNTMVRVGIVVLFFGVAFLLSYFAEHVTIPIELQFSGVALAGVAMIGLGAWLRNARRAYALALVSGGLGVLYLTTFAALQLVPLLSPPSAFALLAAIAVLAIMLSLAFDAQALAALAALGGLLAPVLVETVSEPLTLFGYVAAVNGVILGIAWFRAWRALDVVERVRRRARAESGTQRCGARRVTDPRATVDVVGPEHHACELLSHIVVLVGRAGRPEHRHALRAVLPHDPTQRACDVGRRLLPGHVLPAIGAPDHRARNAIGGAHKPVGVPAFHA